MKRALALAFLATVAGTAALALVLPRGWLTWLLIVALAVVPAFWAAGRLMRPIDQLLRALSGMVTSFREGDFSRSLVVDRNDELGGLMTVHNELAAALREQRAHLVQRELLLDTVMQNSPVALVLVDAHERIAYANLASRHLLSEGRSLNGLPFGEVLQRASFGMPSMADGGDSLFVADIDGVEETFHHSQRVFVLQGRRYRLHLFKRLTLELSRQEVSTWKKLIRVLSHELNNSLGPLSSLAHSGAEIARRENSAALPAVFRAIAERAQHLHHFLGGYAAFAKLPAPRPERIEWAAFVADLARHAAFVLAVPLPASSGWFDRSQVEQALINLLKNAHEAGGEAHDVELAIVCANAVQGIEVRDRGSGMSPAVLAQALLPFYSTKRSGTGLGLALAREIAEAHGGRIQLANREGGGLCVKLILPASSPSPAAPTGMA